MGVSSQRQHSIYDDLEKLNIQT